MKPFWTQTLVWIAAVVAAVLLAMATLEAPFDGHFPHGATAPR